MICRNRPGVTYCRARAYESVNALSWPGRASWLLAATTYPTAGASWAGVSRNEGTVDCSGTGPVGAGSCVDRGPLGVGAAVVGAATGPDGAGSGRSRIGPVASATA